MLKNRLGLGRAGAAGGGGKWPLSSGLCTAVCEFKTIFYSAKPGALKSGSSFCPKEAFESMHRGCPVSGAPPGALKGEGE